MWYVRLPFLFVLFTVAGDTALGQITLLWSGVDGMELSDDEISDVVT
ncbi:11622_t:CDS:2 [Ambispora leptoticha]|uniref:11622_t:CDS:1 n=1 Tax=Ambispora leptoticha TaxID=144679 RepID=A0A9N8W2N3_9GLOM|nr:11622_t:CDS:2 [Ambispora leptoticha]